MKDTDLMPFGKYKGTPMANVPDSYLLWLYGELKEGERKGIKKMEGHDNIVSYVEDYGVENLKP